MGNTAQTEYRDAVYRALERFQFIEEILRVYLDLAIQIAKIELKPYFPVNLTKKDLSKLPLGKLVQMFSQVNGNTALRSELKNVTPDRNHVAHQSMLFTLGELEDDAHISRRTQETNAIADHAKDVHEALLDERYELQRALTRLKANKKRAQSGSRGS